MLKYIKTSKTSISTKIIELENLKNMLKNIDIHGVSMIVWPREFILDGMKCSPLFVPVLLDTWKSEI